MIVGPAALLAAAEAADAETPRAHAATIDPGAASNCGPAAPGLPTSGAATDAARQVYELRTDSHYFCMGNVTGLGLLQDSVGTINPATGVWGAFGIGPDVQALRGLVGACTGVCTGLPTSLYQQLDRLRTAAGAWRSGTSDYDAHSQLWLTDRLDAKAQTTIDKLGLVGDKLDTLHADLGDVRAAIASGATPSSTTTPASSTTPYSTVALSDDDRAQALGNDSELVSVLWVLIGAVIAVPAAQALTRELFTT